MEYIILHRESDDFADVLSDKVIKKSLRVKIKFKNYLIIELSDDKDMSYLILKYGDDVVKMSEIAPDRSPVPYKDYVPKKDIKHGSHWLD